MSRGKRLANEKIRRGGNRKPVKRVPGGHGTIVVAVIVVIVIAAMAGGHR